MEINIVVWLLLGFASYRITRFLVIDTLIENVRNRFHTFLANRRGRLKIIPHKFLDGISCTWCLGFWVSLVVYSLYLWNCPVDFDQVDWLNVFAVAGVQGILHALEPDND